MLTPHLQDQRWLHFVRNHINSCNCHYGAPKHCSSRRVARNCVETCRQGMMRMSVVIIDQHHIQNPWQTRHELNLSDHARERDHYLKFGMKAHCQANKSSQTLSIRPVYLNPGLGFKAKSLFQKGSHGFRVESFVPARESLLQFNDTSEKETFSTAPMFLIPFLQLVNIVALW